MCSDEEASCDDGCGEYGGVDVGDSDDNIANNSTICADIPLSGGNYNVKMCGEIVRYSSETMSKEQVPLKINCTALFPTERKVVSRIVILKNMYVRDVVTSSYFYGYIEEYRVHIKKVIMLSKQQELKL